jgi:penicillin-binding protein 1A
MAARTQAASLTRRFGGLIGVALRTILVMMLWMPMVVGCVAVFELSFMANEIPEVPSLDALQPTFQSRVELLDGARVSGAHATSQVPYDELPEDLLVTFMAAEDEDFFLHTAFNLRAIARAAVENFRSGRTVQGGSTLSQQLAKQFMGRERTYQRKVRELLLARRMESTFSKHELLRVYLETTFLGHTAYGVTQASWLYFGQDPRGLNQGQLATLAGMLPSPNRYSPLRHPRRARAQRDRVLARLHAIGVLSQEELDFWRAQDLELAADHADEVHYPYVHATALRRLTGGDDEVLRETWSEGGLRIVMSHTPDAQIQARRGLHEALEAYDRRQGWRGGLASEWEAPTAHDRLVAGSVTQVSADMLSVAMEHDPEQVIELPRAAITWASGAELKRHYKRPNRLGDVRRSFKVGDRVLLRRDEGEGWSLTQLLSMQGAVFAMDSLSGSVVASVGGHDPAVDIFHRAEQSCRQPGSVFKPLVYAPTLGIGLTPATMVGDIPRELDNEVHGGTWTPRNADRNFKGYITLKQALANSRNVPAAYFFDRVGAPRVIALSRKLGITDTLDPAPALALGASCVEPRQMTAVYTAFQRGGRYRAPFSLVYIGDDFGQVSHHQGHFSLPYITVHARLVAMLEEYRVPQVSRAISAEIAATMWWLLRQVVRAGTAHKLPNDWLVSGKTGTTNQFDAWFVGFDGQLTTGVWVGSDRNTSPIGPGEHGATVAMPAFQEFYGPRARLGDELEWPLIMPETMSFHVVDEPTGLLARPGQYGVSYPFVTGRQPSEYSPTRATRQAEQIDLLTQDF